MKPPKHPLTPDEREAIRLLSRVSMPSASWDKRFNRDVLSHAATTGFLGEKSAPQVWRLLIRYRRQWDSPRKAELLGIAEKLAAPDFRKQQASARAQDRINLARHCAGSPIPKGLQSAYPPTTIDAVKRYKQLEAYQRQERLTSL